MILGVGCDIVKIQRIERLIVQYGFVFKCKIFTKLEITIGENLKQYVQASYYAKRFAAKEALSKALGTGIGKMLGFLDIEITNNELGAPKLACKALQNKHIHISLADEKEFAIAYVVIEG